MKSCFTEYYGYMTSSVRKAAFYSRAIPALVVFQLALVLTVPLHAGSPLTLDSAIRRALEKSPDLANARADLERAKGEQIVADQPLPSNPELELSAVQGNRKISPSPSFSPQAYLNGSDPIDASVNAITGENRQGISGFEVGLSQPLDVLGKRSIRQNSARASVQQASANYERMRIATIAAVREAYISLQSLRKLRIQMEGRLAHLAWIQRNKGQFIDPRLGRYAANAFQNDLIAFRASYRDMQRREADAETGLRALLILPDDESVVLTD
ncbi:MAG: TolC family protein, partial [Leptospiraceae bacterium]|nr:TolC family protein [Leptospiraceae bacterium]